MSHDTDASSIVRRFDQICFSVGDCDAIELLQKECSDDPKRICYFELQEHSKALACQLLFRYRPDYVLVDCQGWTVPEAVATLACMRIQIPFVPVSCYDQHRPGRLDALVALLQSSKRPAASVVAVTVCDNDRDPILSVFQKAGVHQILFLDAESGSLKEQLNVPDKLPQSSTDYSDNLYVLFTSGTSSAKPKAVVGSHSATYRRIEWFLDKFQSSPRIGRRSKLTFVDGVTELWTSLLDQDSILVTVPPGTIQSEGIASIYDKCTQILMLPSQLHQMLLLPKSKTLERVLVSGEVCSALLVKKFFQKYTSCELVNLYGQTESTGDICCAVIDPSREFVENCVPIGAPILDTIRIELDQRNELILHGSQQLANGYLTALGDDAADDNTSRVPFLSFRTGDIGFCKEQIFYIQGRKDDVVKLNGIWTSPSEIEAAFSTAYRIDSPAVAVFLKRENTVTSYLLCSDERACEMFSRGDMHEKHGIPWNLIPSDALFCKDIPTAIGGAGKIDRKACQDIVEAQLSCRSLPSVESRNGRRKSSFRSIAAEALDTEESSLDMSRSFIDLGGNSATAITCVYLLRTADYGNLNGISAVDILSAPSIRDLDMILSGDKPPSKRLKKSGGLSTPFTAVPPKNHSSRHRSLAMRACVDSTPLLIEEKYVYTACQGGVILKCGLQASVIAHEQLHGWQIQGDLLFIKEHKCIVVCAYSINGKGLVAGLSLDLATWIWQHEVDSPIKTTPVVIDDKLFLQTGENVLLLRLSKCNEPPRNHAKLPHPAIAKPLVFQENNGWNLLYASSDWESCLMIVDSEGNCQKALDYDVGPVHKDPILIDDQYALIADSYGALHKVELSTRLIKSTIRLSSLPLSSPLALTKQRIAVGGYDGIVRCIDEAGRGWSCAVGAAVYSTPTMLNSSQILVSTTAGDILTIDAELGSIQSRHRVSAEIWSNFLLVASDDAVVFGARDSCLHFHKYSGCW